MSLEWSFKHQKIWYDVLFECKKRYPANYPFIVEQLNVAWQKKAQLWFEEVGGKEHFIAFVGGIANSSPGISFCGISRRRGKKNKGRVRHKHSS